jgi:pimeloyl-ACP methyl ester carboxylesterase
MNEMKTTTTKKTAVLVHGAFADGSGWQKVIPFLLAGGLNVVAVQHPLTSLADDVAVTKRVIEEAEGEVILVGHSYGGAIITEAGTSDKISALVYVAAFAPAKGESANETQKDYPKPGWLGSIDVNKQGFVKLTPEGMANYFAQDLPASESGVMAVTQGPTAGGCFDEKLTETAWSNKPAWYIVAAEDRMINPDSERKFAAKMNAKTTILASSHVPMLSKPKEVAAVILDAAGLSEEQKQSKGQGQA